MFYPVNIKTVLKSNVYMLGQEIVFLWMVNNCLVVFILKLVKITSAVFSIASVSAKSNAAFSINASSDQTWDLKENRVTYIFTN